MQNSLNRGDMLGLGFGVTVNATMSRLPVELMSKVSTVTLTGGVNTYIPLMNRGSRGALQRESVIASPLIVSTANLAHQLRQENVVDRTMQLARTATHALIGIGPVAGESTLVNDGYMTPEEMNALANQGAVGDVLGIFYNAAGEQLETDLSERRIGISFTELKQIPTVVAVAGGTSKLDAIRGVLNAGVIDVFVTTEDIAAALVGEE